MFEVFEDTILRGVREKGARAVNGSLANNYGADRPFGIRRWV
jgi:hypothetical protein